MARRRSIIETVLRSSSADTIALNPHLFAPHEATPFKHDPRADAPAVRIGRRVLRTRNGNTWTEARYWQAVRSALRRSFRFWKPAVDALLAARRKYAGPRKNQKWEYQCAHCGRWFPRKQVEVDHKVPVGTLRRLEDLPAFLVRLTPEDPAAYQVLCLSCHHPKSQLERKSRHAAVWGP